MGSQPSEEPRREGPSSASPFVDPEALARLVLRCREFTSYLVELAPRLPRREEAPFLYSQLSDAARSLHENLQRLVVFEEVDKEERGGFLRLLSGKKRRVQSNNEPRIDLQGNAWTIPVTELVNFLSHSGKSGVLWVTSPQETFVLEFSQGNLVHATSSATPREFRLGEILLREELLRQDELENEIAGAKSADDLLGAHLVKSGRLTSQQLQRALAIQVQELFHRLMDAENAIYRFQKGVQMLRAQGLEVNITQLLLESARKKDEERCCETSGAEEALSVLSGAAPGPGTDPATDSTPPSAEVSRASDAATPEPSTGPGPAAAAALAEAGAEPLAALPSGSPGPAAWTVAPVGGPALEREPDAASS